MATFLAPAKINLFLHVLARRTDGYHELNTFFQFLDLMDVLQIEVDESGVIERVAGLADIAPDEDLVVRAATKLRDHVANPSLGARISVVKNIPHGAGLGGGSSDAATTLLALDSAWNLGLGRAELAKIGLELGADVPVFIYGKAGWAHGVGEHIVAQAAPLTSCVLVTPPVHVSTGEVFQSLGRLVDRAPLDIDERATAARKTGEEGWNMPIENDLEAIVRARYTEVDDALVWLQNYGHPRMSGSGGSVFLLVSERSEAESIVAERPPSWSDWHVSVVQTLNHHPFDALQPKVA